MKFVHEVKIKPWELDSKPNAFPLWKRAWGLNSFRTFSSIISLLLELVGSNLVHIESFPCNHNIIDRVQCEHGRKNDFIATDYFKAFLFLLVIRSG